MPQHKGRQVPLSTPLKPRTVYILEIKHDAGCPTIRTQNIDHCRCNYTERLIELPNIKAKASK